MRSAFPKLPAAAGFTIIELMVTIAVATVLLTLGVPAFNDMIRNNRIASQTNLFVAGLNFARGEAAKRNIAVSICAATAAHDACSGSNSWANGWIVFTDRTGTAGRFDGTDELIQDGSGPIAGYTLTGTASTDNFVRFGVGMTGSTANNFTITATDSRVCASSGTRLIAVSNMGRINTTRGTC